MALNCSQCYSKNASDGCLSVIELNADVAGIGVLVAFFVATLVSCSTVVLAYLGDALPKSLLSSKDHAVIASYQDMFIARCLLPLIYSYWLLLKSFIMYYTGQGRLQFRPELSRERRVEATTRFLLGFSDQQLVTGLAILVAAFANRSRLTLHELHVVFNLAWFSATTHITTLRALREHLYDHAVVRNWRVLGIFTFVVMISLVQVLFMVAGFPSDSGDRHSALPVQCVIDGPFHAESFGYFFWVGQVTILVILLVVYVPPTVALFSDPRNRHIKTLDRLSIRIARLVHGPWQIPQRTLEALCMTVSVQHSLVTLPGQYRDTFLSGIPTIIFTFAFGISQTVSLLWISGPDTSGEAQTMGFGQVVTIALLAIPVLTAAEIYNEATKSVSLQAKNIIDECTSKPALPTSTSILPEPFEYRTRQQALDLLPFPVENIERYNTLHRSINHRLWQYGEVEKLTPFRRHFIVIATLDSSTRPGHDILDHIESFDMIKPFKKLKYLFTLDICVSIFAGIAMNTTSPASEVGMYTISLFVLFKVLLKGTDFFRTTNMLRHQVELLISSQNWLRSNFGHLAQGEDRLLFFLETQSSTKDEPKENHAELALEQPKRQDTEADIGIVQQAAT